MTPNLHGNGVAPKCGSEVWRLVNQVCRNCGSQLVWLVRRCGWRLRKLFIIRQFRRRSTKGKYNQVGSCMVLTRDGTHGDEFISPIALISIFMRQYIRVITVIVHRKTGQSSPSRAIIGSPGNALLFHPIPLTSFIHSHHPCGSQSPSASQKAKEASVTNETK